MALTGYDLEQIKITVTEVVEPRFGETNRRFDETNSALESRFTQLKDDLANLAATTNRKFHVVFTDVAMVRDDLVAVRQLVAEHGFRIARLEHGEVSGE